MTEGTHRDNCKPNEADNEIKKRIHQCIERAKNETTSLQKIYSEVLQEYKNAGYDEVTKFPSFAALKARLYQQRHRALGKRGLI